MFPQNKFGESSALRGSMTAITPNVEMISARIRRVVVFSASKKGAKIKMNAGVADVTNAPFEAVDNLVPTN